MAEEMRTKPRCTLNVGALGFSAGLQGANPRRKQLKGSDCMTLELTCHHFQPCIKERSLSQADPPPTKRKPCLEIISARGLLGEFPQNDGGRQLPTPMQWRKVIDCPTTTASTTTSTSLVCPPPLSTQCTGETTSWSLLARTAASGSPDRPSSPSRHQGNRSWPGGPRSWRGPGRPRRGPSPGVGCKRRGRGRRSVGGKVRLTPSFPRKRAKARVQSSQGTLHSRGVGGSPASSGAHRLLSSGTLFPGEVCGSLAACPSLRALTVERGTAPPPAPRTWPPSLSPTWMYAIFTRATHSGPGMAPPRPLCPRQRETGEKAKGEMKKRRPVAPDVTGVADERRPPLRRPPRPCLSLRFGSGSRGHLQVAGAEVARFPSLASLAVACSPRSRSPDWNEARAPKEGAGGSRGDCNDPGAGGAEDAGAGERERRGRGWGWRSGWERAVHGSAHPVGARAGTY